MSLEAGFGSHLCSGLCCSSLMPLLSEQLRCAATTLPDRHPERKDCLTLCPKTALSLRQCSAECAETALGQRLEATEGLLCFRVGRSKGCFRSSAVLEEWEELLLPTDTLGAGYRKLCKARVCWPVDKARDFAVRPLNLSLGL